LEKEFDGTSLCFMIPIPKPYSHLFPATLESTQPHITLAYVGKVESAEPYITIVRESITGTPFIPIQFEPQVSYFDQEGERVAKVGIISAELDALHYDILDRFESAGLPFDNNYPEYQPHATINYLGKGQEYMGDTPQGGFNAYQIEADFDKVTVIELSALSDRVAHRFIEAQWVNHR
jgi:2'-5' RNA ligase